MKVKGLCAFFFVFLIGMSFSLCGDNGVYIKAGVNADVNGSHMGADVNAEGSARVDNSSVESEGDLSLKSNFLEKEISLNGKGELGIVYSNNIVTRFNGERLEDLDFVEKRRHVFSEEEKRILNNIVRDDVQEVVEFQAGVSDGKNILKVRGTQKVNTSDGEVSVEVVSDVDLNGNVLDVSRMIRMGNKVVEEKDDELIFLRDGKLMLLQNVTDKEVLRDKLMVKSLKPLVNIERIAAPSFKSKGKFVLQVRKGCFLADSKLVFETDNYNVVYIEVESVVQLLESDCVLKIADEENKEEFIAHEEEVLKLESEEKVRELKLNRSSRDVSSPEELESYMKEEEWVIEEGKESYYQQFVTPEKVEGYVKGLDKEEIYERALSFVWMSDNVLHNRDEKWMVPLDFLENSSKLERNPISEVASDCSEQANTLVSMLRASGVPAEDVRVVLGQVNFDGDVGGHAWVELKEDGKWFVLEATSGDIYDEDVGGKIKRNGVSYNYWKYHEYPVVEVWMYYNDKYYSKEGDIDVEGWDKRAESFLEDSVLGAFEEFGLADFFLSIVEWFKGMFE